MKTLLSLFVIAAALVAFACQDALPVKVPNRFAAHYTTPGGVPIQSVVVIPDERQTEVFAAVDRGIATQIRTSSFHNPTWTAGGKSSDYRLMLIEPDRTNSDGSPALLYDGEIQTAGTVLGAFDDGFAPMTIVLPHQGNQNWTHLYYLEQSARNEAEHYRERLCDERIFYLYTTSGDVHPHWTTEGE